ncbi:MAG: CapA family protein [Myxococcota bacterium]|nr:CapA family protein [Myxococcota bacterium]
MLLTLFLLGCPAINPPDAECFVPSAVQGVVLDMEGNAIPDARVVTDAGETTTDADGGFTSPAGEGNRWVMAEKEGYISRTRPAAPGERVLLRLSPDDGDTFTLVFGGDSMFTRRYQDPDEDGRLDDALIRPSFARTDTTQLLSDIEPLLSSATLTGITLEGPLVQDAEPHPTKEYLFDNPPDVAWALADAGIDLVNLATSHTYDFLDEGVESTLSHLDAAGLVGFGAGMNSESAWGPQIIIRDNHTLGLVACSTISGQSEEPSYEAQANRPGIAACDVDRLRQTIVDARIQADVVIAQLHGGWEYSEKPSTLMQTLATTALEAGAHLVVGNHPHVIQALEMEGQKLIAWSLGNLVFDQTLWETLQSGLLRLELGWNGKIHRVSLEPLILEEFRPRAVRGRLQRQLARDYMGRAGAPAFVDDGVLELDIAGRTSVSQLDFNLSSTTEGWSTPQELSAGWVHEVVGAEDWRRGRDVLLVGDFEEVDLDSHCGEGIFWKTSSDFVQIAPDESGGLLLRHESSHHALDPTWSRPQHRIGLSEGADFTVTGRLRGEGTLRTRLRAYADASTDMVSQRVIELQATPDWKDFQMDSLLPGGTDTLLPEFGLVPPESGSTWLEIDDLRIILWESGESAENPERFDQVQVKGTGVVSTRTRALSQ